MFKFISRWLFPEKKKMPTKLSEQEALAIARVAAFGDPLAEALGLASLQERSGAWVWVVSSNTVGLVLEVSIDDTSGNVLEMRHVGTR